SLSPHISALHSACPLYLLITYSYSFLCSFFFNDTATTEIYTLSLHDALPILLERRRIIEEPERAQDATRAVHEIDPGGASGVLRSEEHTSELQSRENLVCRLLLEKKNKKKTLWKSC